MSLTPAGELPSPAPEPGPVRQLSLFGVEAADPSPADLAGLLAGPADVVRMGGTARVSVVVAEAWRVHVLVAELSRRGLTPAWEAVGPDGGHEVRTAYATTLAPLGTAWLSGGVKHPPPGFHLNGRRLRLWTAAAGVAEPGGHRLHLGATDEPWWPVVGRALAAVGLPAVLVESGAGGPAFRLSGRRRTARLAELVGDRPVAAPVAAWPSPYRPATA